MGRRWRTHTSVERGGVPHEGARSPRARRSFARGGVQPSSKAEFRPRGRWGRRLVGPLALLGPWLWFVIDEFVLRFYYFAKMGFPQL
jgi:hypothetical protein